MTPQPPVNPFTQHTIAWVNGRLVFSPLNPPKIVKTPKARRPLRTEVPA